MVEYVSECNGCPECHYCGRKTRKRAIYSCDWCRKECEQKDSHELDGEMVCSSCYDKYTTALDEVYEDMEE